MKVNSVKKLCHYIWDLEAEMNLLDMQSNGVHIYQYLRMPIYYKLSESLGILEKPVVNESRGISKYFSRLKFLSHSLLSVFNYFKIKNYDYCVIEHDRKVDIGVTKVDIYSHGFRKKISKKGSVISIYLPNGSAMEKNDSLNESFNFSLFFIISSIGAKISSFIFKQNHSETFEALEKRIFDDLGVRVKLSEMFHYYTLRFKIRKFFIEKLLKKIKPKDLFIVVAYSGRGDFVQVAKELGINTVELQHGVISRYHLGYSYPVEPKNPIMLPNSMYFWSRDWDLGSIMPSSIYKNYEALDCPFYKSETQLSEWLKNKSSRSITVISQGALTEEIANYIYKNHKSFIGLTVNYKLHPSEYEKLRDSIGLKKLTSMKNVNIIKDTNLHKLMVQSHVVIGVFSTALIEARMLGCRVIIIGLPGSEYFEYSSGYEKVSVDSGIVI